VKCVYGMQIWPVQTVSHKKRTNGDLHTEALILNNKYTSDLGLVLMVIHFNTEQHENVFN
jgi:hypothetical protein